MKEIIQNIYETNSVLGRSGQIHKLHSAIDSEEGEFLFSIIKDDPKILTTLEVGCAYGLSSLYICSALRDRPGASHTIIDPFENTDWDGVGVKNLEEAGIDFFKLMEIKSEIALPKLIEMSDDNENQFDFIFVDGRHTFDQTLIDCFYATRLLRIGGILTIDDVYFPSVRRVVDFIKNYPCYEEHSSVGDSFPKSWKINGARFLLSPIKRKYWAQILSRILYKEIFDERYTRMIALRKIKEDNRKWDWHNDAF